MRGGRAEAWVLWAMWVKPLVPVGLTGYTT